MNQLNRKLAPEIESVYVIASPDYSFLSSTGVKEMATFGGDVAIRPRPGGRWPRALAERAVAHESWAGACRTGAEISASRLANSPANP